VSEIPSFSVTDAVSRTAQEWEAAEAADEPGSSRSDAHSNDEDALWQYNLVVPNLALDTGCSSLHPANTAPSEEQQSLSQRLLSLLLTSKLVRLRDLEIYHHQSDSHNDSDEAGPDEMEVEATAAATLNVWDTGETAMKAVKAYWVLYIDMLCISYAGRESVFDAAWLALLSALRTTTLPGARWDADAGAVVCSADVPRSTNLQLRGTPVPLSWGVCILDSRILQSSTNSKGQPRREVVLIDMDTAEEESCRERGCVVVDMSAGEGAELVRLEKSGGSFVGAEQLAEIVGVAEDRWREYQQAFGDPRTAP
jgi:exosome complex component RRP43